MKGLLLYGIYCTRDIWLQVEGLLSDFDIDYVEYPHSLTQSASCVTDITRWVHDTYGGTHYDFVVGHSLGGIIALELAVKFGLSCRQIILIDSNLKPANQFYRNLLTPEHMQAYGNDIVGIMRDEAKYYQEGLKRSLQQDFDYTEYVQMARQDVHAIYGDRGQAGYVNRISDLCLDKSISDKMVFSFVEDACHLPMIENPTALASIVSNIVLNK